MSLLVICIFDILDNGMFGIVKNFWFTTFKIEENIESENKCERIHKTLRKIELAHIENVRLLRVDARLAMVRYFQPRSLERIHCLFPCPWPKKNQVKHRLFSRDFLKLLNNPVFLSKSKSITSLSSE